MLMKGKALSTQQFVKLKKNSVVFLYKTADFEGELINEMDEAKKINGVLQIAREFNISNNEIIAFGDDTNDT